MQIKNKRKKTLSDVGTALGWSLLIFFLLGSTGILFSYLPDPHTPSILGLKIAIGLSFVVAACGFYNRLWPNWWMEFLIYFCLVGLLFAGAIRGVGLSLGKFWLVPLLIAYLLTWILPVIYIRFAKIMYQEQTNSRTVIGNGCMYTPFGLFGVAMVLGATAGFQGFRFSNLYVSMFLIGTLFSFAAIGLGQYFSCKMWMKYPGKNL
jgi:hypothetical protein